VRTRASARITTIRIYVLATLVVFQGMLMLLPVTAVTSAQEVILKDRRRRKHEVELAQVFPDVWVQHISRTEEKNPVVVNRVPG
jgi:hypothetical protein